MAASDVGSLGAAEATGGISVIEALYVLTCTFCL